MEQVKAKSYRAILIIMLSFLVLIVGLYSTAARANSSTQSLSGTQLAYFIGYHSSPSAYGPDLIYYGPQYYHPHQRKLYWTGWRHVGHGCRKNCLVDRWNGHVLRCNRVCR